jgi:hypothetical protein
MTELPGKQEGLHGKSEIAEQLAWRDQAIARLNRELAARVPLIAAALDLADRLNQDDRCDEEQEALCRVVEDYRAKVGR